MAKDKDNKDGIVKVEHLGADADQDFVDSQNQALEHYKLTGVNDQGYIDPTRDQEPDIAPEFGVAPHPELANPAPPRESFSGRALDASKVAMVQDVGDKEENAKDATEAFNEAVQEREKLFKETSGENSSEGARANTSTPTGDESLALAQTANPAAAADAQLPQDIGDDSVDASAETKSKSKKK